MKWLLVVLVSFYGSASAQNAGGVFGPKVREGYRAFEYRLSVAEPASAGTPPWVQRVQWQTAFNGRLEARADLQWRDPGGGSDVELDFIRGLLLVEAGQPRPGWTTGFRFDARIRNGSGPDELAAHWTNQFDLTPRVYARFNVLTRFDFSDRVSTSPSIETRASLFRSLRAGHSVGMELYNGYGQLEDFRPIESQYHEAAPVVFWALPGPYTLYTSIGIGLTDPAPDHSLRLRLIRQF